MAEATKAAIDRRLLAHLSAPRQGDHLVLVASAENIRSELSWQPSRLKLATIQGHALDLQEVRHDMNTQ